MYMLLYIDWKNKALDVSALPRNHVLVALSWGGGIEKEVAPAENRQNNPFLKSCLSRLPGRNEIKREAQISR